MITTTVAGPTPPATGTRRFRRTDATLWRDTGQHVLALPPGAEDVVILGGGAAVVWRLLRRELDLEAIVSQLADDAADPGRDVVASTLAELTSIGLIVATLDIAS